MTAPRTTRSARRLGSSAALALALALVMASAGIASAAITLIKVSSDPYANTSSFHRTEVEPDTFGFGSTIVGAFQVGRFADGGASNVGWTTSRNGGKKWRHGYLPGTTTYATPAGTFDRVTDPSVAYDAMHNVWMIETLGMIGTSGSAVIVNRSADGGLTWSDPVTVASAVGLQDFDKNWIVCDDTATSPFYGHCYAQWDDFGTGNLLHMAVSSDGGQTWTGSASPGVSVIGGQPLVQPGGNVIVPIDDGAEGTVESFVSADGGVTYAGPFTVATIASHAEAGDLRSGPLPSAEIDGSGTVYVVWGDCSFRTSCSSNDIVMSTSSDGITWTAPVRIPIDPVSSTVDHFLPGLALDRATSGGSAHLGLTYYYYPQTSCSASTCKLDVGFVSSSDGGASWTAPKKLAGPITLTWLPLTSQGYMVGDYLSTSYAGGTAHSVFAVAKSGTCQLGQITSCVEYMATTAGGLVSAGPLTRAGLDRPVAGAHGDHPTGGLKSSR